MVQRLDFPVWVWYNIYGRFKMSIGKGVNYMGMTDKQFNGFVRFVLDDILEVLAKLPESEEKEKLQKVADNLQKTLED